MALVVNDVTLQAQQTQYVSGRKNRIRSSITPFQEMLDKEERLYAPKVQTETQKGPSAKKVQKVDQTSSVTSSSAGSDRVDLKEIFQRASAKYDISYDFLVAVAKAESDFNTKCVSSAGAEGIMQVMPEEQKGLGIKDPFDAEQNIMGAAKLLKAHLKKFNGDYTLAAAAYNAGSGRVQKYGGVPPFTETQNYVKKIQKYRKDGVTVPDVKVQTDTLDEENGIGSGASAGTFDKGAAATDADWEKVTVGVGTGESAVTMSYGAYLKYLELGNTGVG